MGAAAEAGFVGYDPDACLINRYVAGAKLGLHQYRDENDLGLRSCLSRWDYPLFSCGVGNVVPIQCAAFNLKTQPLAEATGEVTRFL